MSRMKVTPNSDISIQADIVFWQSIENSDDPHDFEDYLNQFPDGQFVALAHRRLSHTKIASSGRPLLNKYGSEALIVADVSYDIDILEWLKAQGTDTNAQDNDRMSEFANSLLGFVARMEDGPQKQELQEALEVCPSKDLEVVLEEQANKNMKSVRKELKERLAKLEEQANKNMKSVRMLCSLWGGFPEEQANKNMKSMRQCALESGKVHVIAKAGRIENLRQAAFVLSSDTILFLIGSVHDETERRVARRRPASALLAQLKPLDASVVSLRLGSRTHEETRGGRGRIF